MVTHNDILDVLRTIDDPEMPINIVDLGLVEKVEFQPAANASTSVSIVILPTFVGCHALPMIESEIHRCVAAMPGVAAVDVRISYAPPWSVDRITPAGRERLRRVGVSVPQAGDENAGKAPACPFCGSASVHLESAFGPTRCKMIWHCESCRHPFEHMKRLASPGLLDVSLERLGKVR